MPAPRSVGTPPAGSAPRGGRAIRAGGGRKPFEYAIVRIVPRVDRGERFNAGIVLHSRPHRFLGARTHLDAVLLRALAPGCDPEAVRPYLDAIDRIAAGDERGGPIARLSPAERFHWLVAPSSTMVETSAVHTGMTDDPAAELERLFAALVLDRR